MYMRKVAIIGAGITKFGELWDKSLRELFVEAALKAVDDANVDLKEIQALYVGSMSPGLFAQQEHIAPLMADYLGLTGIPATRTEGACASGGLAFLRGVMDVMSGLHDIVLVGGVEKMTDVTTERCTYILATASDQEYEAFHGLTFVGEYALMARRHMYQYGTTKEQMAMVAVKNHRNAVKNPHAHLRREVTLETCLASPMIAEPLQLFDCSLVSDGAAAAIICPLEIAKKFTDTPILVAGFGQATESMATHDREDITKLRSTIWASQKAYKMAGVEPKDIDLAEVHDCFTIAEIMAYEDLGFCKKGEGGKLVEEGETEIGGKIPVNTSGGLKAKGHPVGATGVAQIHEIVLQLRGEAGERQVEGAELGLTHNIGGSGGTCVVTILKRL